MDFGKERKVTSVAVDSNVILDLNDLEGRGKQSLNTILLLIAFDIKRVGVGVVARELERSPALFAFYKKHFPFKVKPTREEKGLARQFEEAGLKAGDAAIIATAAIERVSFFLSWNRGDIVNERIQAKLLRISKNIPLLLTPEDFFCRIRVSGKVLSFSPSPVLPVSRLRFSSPKSWREGALQPQPR